MVMLKEKRAYSMTFWAVFFGFVLVPALAMAIELGRYFYARSEVAKAADAAAVAAAAEINQRVFQSSGDLTPTDKTWANAQNYAFRNNSVLSTRGINAYVTGIAVDSGADTVRVTVSADLSLLFPSVVPKVIIHETGVAQVRAFSR
jgi:Flp pilus assembly protein TadG